MLHFHRNFAGGIIVHIQRAGVKKHSTKTLVSAEVQRQREFGLNPKLKDSYYRIKCWQQGQCLESISYQSQRQVFHKLCKLLQLDGQSGESSVDISFGIVLFFQKLLQVIVEVAQDISYTLEALQQYQHNRSRVYRGSRQVIEDNQ